MTNCEWCDNPFHKTQPKKRFCSKKCQNAKHYHDNKIVYKQKADTWIKLNREKHAVSVRKWEANNPDKKRENYANYRAAKKNATPKWADRKEIARIHKLATEKGLEVDHIVPLSSPLVCGLHCEDNLRCIPQPLNRHKSNRYWPDM